MIIIEICPKCSSPGLTVEIDTVQFFCKDKSITEKSYYACCNHDCDVAYFSNETEIKTNQLNNTLWYKDKSLKVPVCYCSNLTRFEVLEAVYNGASTISEVQDVTGKDRTGYCKEENPIGGCCRNVFLYTIEQGKKIRSESLLKCPKCKIEKLEKMPFGYCTVSYKCTECGEVLSPKHGDCCLYCTYGTELCPTKQLESIINSNQT